MTSPDPLVLVDTHCHLDDSQFDSDRDAVIARAHERGVRAMVSIGTGDHPAEMDAGLKVARCVPFVYATAGVHPQHANEAQEAHFDLLRELATEPDLVAIGEIGLDYHYPNMDRTRQHDVFRRQMALAAALGKPVVIHTRDAWEDTFRLLEEEWAPTGLPCVMHCFSGGPAEAERALAAGFLLSFSGIVTYPKATAVHEAARLTPLARILVETDAPYLSPAPNRGKRNEPAFVVDTARRLAELRGEEFTALAAATTDNFQRTFGVTIQQSEG